ncbi:metallophosphoesterase [Mycobacterium sp. Y57]|uniref:metallophosphoesterase n=1 Tax=Mycolicibacterium xanthum TaxID=2796469 RepID=UPI001C841ECF|nr:metallophosphoesterase [Mycolicibacterium xanthum]MBX7435450.1 metallophosphoesterase [Mycolicibacterium xanthum]
MTTGLDEPGYDIIGDIHGCADKLEALLTTMGYRTDGPGTAYRHPRRTAIFVGDLIDRGDRQLRVLQIVKPMVDAGSARMVLGNHEFNALAYATERPGHPGKFLRPHDDPGDPSSAKNEKQHERFLEELKGDARTEYLDWFWTQPLWLDLGDVRVVHACWHDESIALLERELGGNRLTTVDQLVRATDRHDPVYHAVETALKGPEISLVARGQPAYLDKDGHPRSHARLRWWDEDAKTLRDIVEISSAYTTVQGDPYPELPDVEVAAEDRDYVYSGDVPVFYGHYWRHGDPQHLRDWTDRTACVDFSAVKGGSLMVYRWSGESRIRPGNYVGV